MKFSENLIFIELFIVILLLISVHLWCLHRPTSKKVPALTSNVFYLFENRSKVSSISVRDVIIFTSQITNACSTFHKVVSQNLPKVSSLAFSINNPARKCHFYQSFLICFFGNKYHIPPYVYIIRHQNRKVCLPQLNPGRLHSIPFFFFFKKQD